MPNPMLYVLLNGELNLSPGKAAAQAVHAAAMISDIGDFGKYVERTVIILEAKNTQQILNFHQYLKRMGFESQYYIDEGVNEVDVYSVTALAVQVIWSNDLEEREMLRQFPLFPSKPTKKKRRYFNHYFGK